MVSTCTLHTRRVTAPPGTEPALPAAEPSTETPPDGGVLTPRLYGEEGRSPFDGCAHSNFTRLLLCTLLSL
jgi:hypothetical protein